MRLVPVLVSAALVTLAARSAAATPLCDTAGHFCLQVDTTTATVCQPLRPGGLTVAKCLASDGDTRKLAKQVDEHTHGAVRMVDTLVVRFEEWTAHVTLFRRDAAPEVPDGAAREALQPFVQGYAHAAKEGWLVEETAPPTLSRVNGVQVARLEERLSSAGVDGAILGHSVAFEVRTRDAAYVVKFDALETDAQRLVVLADATLATLDAVPVHSGAGPAEGLTWLLRGLVAAVILVGLGWVVGRVRRGSPSRA
jgi:hypothetical protein